MRIPWYYPFIGVLAGFGLMMAGSFLPNADLSVIGIVVLLVFGWIFAIRFFFTGCGFFSLALMD